MDEIFKSEVILVVMEKEEGVSFEEFSGLFHQVHGYQLKLTNYGYKSLKNVLDDMKDEVEILNVNGQQLIKCRPPCPLNVIAPSTDISFQENEPFVTEPCSASSNKDWSQSGDNPLDEFPKEQPSCKPKQPGIRCHKLLPPAKQSTLQSEDYSTREASCTKHTCHTRKQMPSNKIVKIISQKIRSHHTGLGAAKLRQCILEQHKIDLELYSQNLGYTDMLSMLIEIPVIRFRNTSEKNIIIESNLFEDQDLPSAKVELCNAGPSSTSSLTSSAKHSAQLDVSSKKKNGPHDLGSKTEFTRKVNHTQPISSHEDPTPILMIDGNAEKKNNPTQKYNNSQLEPPKKDLFFLNNVADFLRGFPSGLRIEKLKQHVLNTHHIDLEALSKELGYNDMPSMLKQVPGITSLNGDVFFASAIPKSKEQLKQVKKVKFSEKRLVDYLKMFPCGMKVDNLRQHMKNQYKIDLMKYSQEKGSTDMVDMLQKVPGIKVLNKDLIIASDVYKKSNGKSNATIKTTPVKCPISATPGVTKSLQVKIKTPQVNLAVSKPSTSRPTGTSQQLSLPTHHIPFTNATINSPQNVHQGLRPNMSYASACASNLMTNQVNVQNLQCPPTFNVQKAHTAKIAQPNHREAPKDVIQSSNIKDKLQLLLKSHSNGLSIFQLKKLFLLKFQQPLACRGASVRKILKNMEDVAHIKGVGVQMKVFPVLSEDNPSANICSDSTPQGAAVSSPLLIKNNTEHIKHSVPVLLSRQQPSSGYSHTELTGGHVPKSSTGDISHKQTLCHTTDIFNNKWDTTTISHPANNLHPAGDAENISDAQWPLLPQRLNILKEIKQRAKVSDQLPENIPNNDLCLKPNPTATSQPQGKDNSAQSLLKAHQDPSKTHCKIDDKQEPQTSELAHPIQQPGFSFVLEETGFSFLMGETKVDKDKNHMEMGLVGPPPNMFTDSTQVVFKLSGKDAKRNTHATPVQPNQSAHCNMAAPEARRHSVNVLPQQLMSDFSSKKVPQQTETHPVASGFSTPNQKSNNSQSQQGQTHNNNNIFDPLILDPKRQQVTHTQTHFTSLQAQGIPPSSSSVQMVSMPSKGQQKTSSSKSVCEFEQKRSTPLPSKQEVTKSNLNNKSGLAGSTKSQTREKAPTSKTKIKAGNQHEPTEKNLTGVQTASNGSQAFSSVSQIQQVPTNPSVDTKGAPISDTLHKDVDFNAVNGMSILETQKKEHLQTRVVGTKTPPSSNQQKANTGCVYTREQTVTEPFQTQPKVPDPHTSSSMEQSRSSPTIHHYYNGTAGTAPEQEKRFTSKSHQHVSHWDHRIPPVLSAHPITPTNQQDSSDNSSEESTQTWQTDSDRSCCIL